MEHVASTGADVICITCAPQSDMARFADIAITPQVGAEILTGSSRMKAGTAQKMVLNMLSTGAMIRTGKVFGNLVDVKPVNKKLMERQKGIIMTAVGCSQEQAAKALNACDGNCKAAIAMLLADIDATAAMFLQKKQRPHSGSHRLLKAKMIFPTF
jgi:N-acetylmuramic acid 6-phosphate etherase